MLNLDVYYCVSCVNEFAVKQGKEPDLCPFCGDEVIYSHYTGEEDSL